MKEAIQKYNDLKIQMEEIQEELDQLTEVFLYAAKFENGRKTAYVEVDGAEVKIEKRFYDKWDQALLKRALQRLGKDTFETLFKPTYVPISKIAIDAWVSLNLDSAYLLKDAYNYRPGKPRITIVSTGEET